MRCFLRRGQDIIIQIPLSPRFYIQVWVLRLLFPSSSSFLWGRQGFVPERKRSFLVKALKRFAKLLFVHAAPPFKTIYACGNKNILDARRLSRQVVSLPNIEYQSIISSASFVEAPSPRILYVDQGDHDHPDFELLGYKKVDASKHFSEVSAFLSRLHADCRIPITFCMHPRVFYSDEILDLFSDFTIVNGISSQLEKSSHVLSSTSTCIEILCH